MTMLGIRSTTNYDDRKRDDVSRLLDPSYNTSYYRSNQRQNTYGVYVDAQGDLHDPDYRQFPLINQSHRFGSSGGPKKHWELVDEGLALTADDDEDVHQDFGYNKRNSFSSSSARYSPTMTRQNYSQFHYTSPRRSNSPSGRGVGDYSSSGAVLSSSPAFVAGSPISTLASSSSSSSSVLSRPRSPFDSDNSPKEKSRCRIAALKRKRGQSSVATLDREHEEEQPKLPRRVSHEYFEGNQWPRNDDNNTQQNRFVEDVEEEEEQEEEDEDLRRKEQGDHVPTCAESLRRQWQALSLRIRFGVFRAEKTIKRRVQSLI